jgi:transcriptional antiterminator RfaH
VPAAASNSLFPDTLAWYVVHTRTKAEHVAAGMMQSVLSIPTYCPRIKFQRSTARGKVWFIEALFPSYFFAQFNPATSLRAVRSAQSVLNVLEFGGSLAQVPDEVIAAIRKEMDGQEIREIHTPLQPGDSVMIAAGPMRGFQGIVHSLRSGEDRVRVLLDFLGSQHPVEMPTHTVLSPRSARSVLADQTRQQGA